MMGPDTDEKPQTSMHFLMVCAILITAVLLAFGLIAMFGKIPKQQASIENRQDKTLNCFVVKIVYVNNATNETVLEKIGEGPQLRIIRGGMFGSVGDIFQFCEKVN